MGHFQQKRLNIYVYAHLKIKILIYKREHKALMQRGIVQFQRIYVYIIRTTRNYATTQVRSKNLCRFTFFCAIFIFIFNL